jgi:hypothetical protein
MVDASAAEPTEIAPTTGPVGATKFIHLYAGNELTGEDADAVTLRSPAHLVVFAGAAESGKTTVLASIYDRLSEGPFAEIQFAGSRSLLGFEQICHLNRLVSGGTRPDTPHTPLSEEASYYHLALRAKDHGSRRRHILLSAISGELFRLATNSRDDCERLTFLRRANTLVVLIDGARLAVPTQRTQAQSEASSILESFLDANMIGSRCRVEFVFSKLDLLLKAGEVAKRFLETTELKFQQRFAGRVPNLAFRRIAARPENESTNGPFKDGLADAFVAWTTSVAAPVGGVRLEVPPRDAREFAKYGWRHLARKEAP